MSTELAVSQSRTLFTICDDLTTWQETLDLLEAQLAQETDADERGALTVEITEVRWQLDRIGGELITKTDNFAGVLRRIDTETEAMKQARERLKTRIASAERAKDWLKEYGLSVMKQNGIKTLKTAENTLYIRASDSVEITDAMKVPAEYHNAEIKIPLRLWNEMVEAITDDDDNDELTAAIGAVRVKAEPSLSTIKKAIKSGVDVPGATIRFNDNLVLR
jgi:hypothetical protein